MGLGFPLCDLTFLLGLETHLELEMELTVSCQKEILRCHTVNRPPLVYMYFIGFDITSEKL